jgi:Protein of unknown function (DUF732)
MKRIAATVFTLLVLSTGTAHADSTDDRFVAALVNEGIGKGIPPEKLIHLGHTICSDLSHGRSVTDAMKGLYTSGIGARDAGALVGASIGAYCPQYSNEVP